MQEITIYDIARMADVSASTVSRVINNNPNVAKKTRSKILKLLETYNYVPNEAARGLVKQSSHMVGILITDIRTTQHTNGIYYLQRELADEDYTCLIYNTGRNEEEWKKYVQALSQRKVDAAVLMGSIYQTETMRALIETYLPTTPVVLCNGFLEGPNIYGILADEFKGVSDCVRLLSGKKRLHPAFISNQLTPSNSEKLNGYKDGMRKYYPGEASVVSVTGNESIEIYRATEKLMQEHPETDCIIYADDTLALAGLRALADMGKNVPGDIAVIGTNNSQYAELSIPTLTSLDNLLYDISSNAARNILAILSGRKASKKMVICAEIVERQST